MTHCFFQFSQNDQQKYTFFIKLTFFVAFLVIYFPCAGKK